MFEIVNPLSDNWLSIQLLVTLSLHFYVYWHWINISDNISIYLDSKACIMTMLHTKINLSQLNLSQTRVKYVKLKIPNLIKNFKLLFNNMTLYSLKTLRHQKYLLHFKKKNYKKNKIMFPFKIFIYLFIHSFIHSFVQPFFQVLLFSSFIF